LISITFQFFENKNFVCYLITICVGNYLSIHFRYKQIKDGVKQIPTREDSPAAKKLKTEDQMENSEATESPYEINLSNTK